MPTTSKPIRLSRRHDALSGKLGEWSTPRGTVESWHAAPGVVVTLAGGHIDRSLADRIIESGNVGVASGMPLIGLHDWEALTSYDSDARTALTSWGLEIRSDVQRVHILVKSKLVRMGVSVASIVLVGMIVAHRERGTFDREIFDALAARRPR